MLERAFAFRELAIWWQTHPPIRKQLQFHSHHSDNKSVRREENSTGWRDGGEWEGGTGLRKTSKAEEDLGRERRRLGKDNFY